MVLKKAISYLNEGDARAFADELTLASYTDSSYADFCRNLQIKNPIGVKRTVLKRLASEIVDKAKVDRKVFLEGGRLLWKKGTSEHRALAIMMLAYVIQRDGDFPLVLSSKWIRKAAGNCDSWELADDFGMNVLGLILARDIYQLDEIITWTDDPNPWLRRTIAVSAWGLYQHGKKQGDSRVDCSLELLGKLMSSPEPEVKFGVMWPLRMLCNYEPDLCIPFMRKWLENGDKNAKWIVRNASKKLSNEDLMKLDDLL